MKQDATGVGSISDLDGVESGVTGVCGVVDPTVRVRENGRDTVESRVGDALVTVVEILTARPSRTVLQLAELHLLTGLAGVTARTFAPEVVPRYVARAVVIARTAHAHVVRHHTLENFLVVEGDVAELNERRNVRVVCLKRKIAMTHT